MCVFDCWLLELSVIIFFMSIFQRRVRVWFWPICCCPSACLLTPLRHHCPAGWFCPSPTIVHPVSPVGSDARPQKIPTSAALVRCGRMSKPSLRTAPACPFLTPPPSSVPLLCPCSTPQPTTPIGTVVRTPYSAGRYRSNGMGVCVEASLPRFTSVLV